MKKVVVVGIGTDVGKTIVSSILVEKYKCAYWKTVQSGDLENSDSIKVQNNCSFDVQILPEAYRLTQPFSPHFSAELDGVKIDQNKLILPEIEENLLIESAGGLMVPLNYDGLLFIDVIKAWKIPVVLVSRHYLGSINHTLLSLELLKNYQIPVNALIWVGGTSLSELATEKIILSKYKLENTVKIPLTENLNSQFIQEQASTLEFSKGIF
jgi:dethiobiotin synthetase